LQASPFGFTDAQRDEISDIAGDACADEITDDETIANLESRVAELEQQVSLNRQNINTAFSAAKSDEDTMNHNAQVLNQGLARLSRIETRLGL